MLSINIIRMFSQRVHVYVSEWFCSLKLSCHCIMYQLKKDHFFTLVKKLKIVTIVWGLILRMIKWFDRQLVHVCQYHWLNSIVNRLIKMVSSSVPNLLNLLKFIGNAMLFSFTMNQMILTAYSWFKVMLRRYVWYLQNSSFIIYVVVLHFCFLSHWQMKHVRAM